MNPTKLELVSLLEVQETEVEWLWYPYIPYGKLTIIQGDPGGGEDDVDSSSFSTSF